MNLEDNYHDINGNLITKDSRDYENERDIRELQEKEKKRKESLEITSSRMYAPRGSVIRIASDKLNIFEKDSE